jgi:2-amino-4-hydroxy-6-hydroxymethyldihydropteridine diphosphokinase
MNDKRVYLGLGSNLGDRRAQLEAALGGLEQRGIRVVARSSIYESEPQDVTDQPWFLNMAVACETRCFPVQLMAGLLGLERELGRQRAGVVKGGPRAIDLDILLWGRTVVDRPNLQIPHPRLLDRRFVLEPLVELAPELRHPVTGELLKEALGKVRGQALQKLT